KILRAFPAIRQWIAVGSIVGLAACDSLSALSPRAPAISNDFTLPNSAPESVPPTIADRGRAVATMPAGRRLDDPGPEIVVRGREPVAIETSPGTSGSASPMRPGDITLNFAGADVRDVVGTVLGDMLKLNYVIDPDVTGPITVNVSRPVSREELL